MTSFLSLLRKDDNSMQSRILRYSPQRLGSGDTEKKKKKKKKMMMRMMRWEIGR
jgi:hypothetical protein